MSNKKIKKLVKQAAENAGHPEMEAALGRQVRAQLQENKNAKLPFSRRTTVQQFGHVGEKFSQLTEEVLAGLKALKREMYIRRRTQS